MAVAAVSVAPLAPALKPVYLLTGSDRPKLETALARLRGHFEPEAVELQTAQRLSGEELVALCNAGSLFGERRLVVVEGIDGKRGASGRLAGGWRAADIKALSGYLLSPAPGTVLALVADGAKKDAALAKLCAQAGTVLAYEVAKRSLPSWVAAHFAQAGASADAAACAALLELVGDDLQQLASEIEKLATWAGGKPIGQAEVELLVAAVAETPIFTLTDAWAARDLGHTLAASELIFEREGQPRRETAPRLASALTSHIAFMRHCQQLAGQGMNARQAATTLKRHPFYVGKVFAQAASFTTAELEDAALRLAALDQALKGGSRLAPDLELQRALIEISNAQVSR